MIKNLIIFFTVLIFFSNIHAQENRLLIQDLDLKAYISLDREQYRIGDDIYLNVEMINQTSDAVKFYSSPYKLNNIKLQVLNLQDGNLLEERYNKIVENNKLRQERPELFKLKEKTLYPDEVLKFKINLPEYFQFKDQGRYKIRIEFDPFPSCTRAHKIFISNPLFLILKDSIIDEEYKDLIFKLKELEEKRRYTPEGTIKFMLDSYKSGDWESYYLYQNLDTVILQYDVFKDKFLKASKVMKKKVISDFKQWNITRKNRKIDTFKILDVYHSYKNKSSIVKCRVKYRAPAVYKNFIYKYKLLQKGIKWIVVDIDVHTYSKKHK